MVSKTDVIGYALANFTAGFKWDGLNKGDLVVDVAGGIGSTSLVLAKTFPDLQFVTQDIPRVVPDGVKVCARLAIDRGLPLPRAYTVL
jgi:hypothetical protein